MLKKILLGLLVLVVILAAVIATRPADFRVTRSKTMAASPEAIYANLTDFRRWAQWSPWEHRDPAMKREFSGAPSGTGAKYAWAGNSDVGEGRMTITDARPSERVAILLEFDEPMAATSNTEFKLTPSGSGTNVEWTMSGRNNFLAKGMTLFMSMDKIVGNDFEQGLAKLDSVSRIPVGG